MSTTESLTFEQLLDIVKSAVSAIFTDEQIAQCVYNILEEGFEEGEEVFEDLEHYDDCTVIPDSSAQIKDMISNQTIKYKWNDSIDEKLLYELLIKIFKENITDLQTLISAFSTQKPLPNTLIECTNDNIVTIACIVSKSLNENSKKKQINLENVSKLFIEQKFDGNALSNMKPKTFIDSAKPYKIPKAKCRKLFKGIIHYFKTETAQPSTDNQETEHKNGKITKAKALPQSLSECDSEYLLQILDGLLNKSDKFKPFKPQIVSYFTQHRIDGPILSGMKRKEFANNLIKHCDNNKKIRGSAGALYKKLIDFDFGINDSNETKDEFKDVTSDIIADIASDLMSESLQKIYTKTQKNITQNRINGQTFMNEWNGGNNNGFNDFFEHKICKYHKFREWFVKELRNTENMSVIIADKSMTDFIHFILDGLDEFIANLFREQSINATVILSKGGRDIAMDICNEYHFAKGPLIELCTNIETVVRDKKYKKYLTNNTNAMPKKWYTKVSKRTLAVINVENESKEQITKESGNIWNGTVIDIKDCDSKQIFHILNEYILPQLKDNDKIQTYKAQIIAYFESNHFNGVQLLDMSRKDFATAIVTQCNGNKQVKGAALKIWNMFKKFDMSQISSPASEPSIDDIKTMEQCTVTQMVYILDKHILDSMNNAKINNNRTAVLSYFSENSVNGTVLFGMAKKQFSAAMVKHCNGNKKVNGAAAKLYRIIKEFDINNVQSHTADNSGSLRQLSRKSSVSPEQSQTNPIWNDDIQELSKCDSAQILYILNECIFAELPKEKKFDALRENMSLFIAYFEQKKVNGQYLMSVERKTFGVSVVEFGENNSKVRGPALKLLKLLKEFDFNRMIQGASTDLWSNNPSNIEQCNLKQMCSLIDTAQIFIDKPAFVTYKSEIIKYFTNNDMNGSKFAAIDRKTFSNTLATFLGDKKTRGLLVKLWKNLNEFGSDKIEEKMDISWENKPNSIAECTVMQVSHILSEYILKRDIFDKLEEYKPKIIKFMNESAFDGQKLTSESSDNTQSARKEFGSKLSVYLGNKKTMGKIIKIYTALIDFDLLLIPELKEILNNTSVKKPPSLSKISIGNRSKRKSIEMKNTSLFSLESIQENSVSSIKPSRSVSPRNSPGHARSPSAPMIAINGIVKKGKHARFTTHTQTLTLRESNEKLAEMSQNEFCEWVIECTQNIAGSNTVKIMIDSIGKKNKITGKALMKHSKKAEKLEQFIQTHLYCNEVYFLKYISAQIMSDHKNNKVAFENLNSKELSDYIQTQSYAFPAYAFRKHKINGEKYSQKDSKFLLNFLRTQCGFRAGTARPLIHNIDKYPNKPVNNNSMSVNIASNQSQFQYSNGTHNRRSTFDKLAGPYHGHDHGYHNNHYSKPALNNAPYSTSVIRDDASDASEANEVSMSHSVNPYMHSISQNSKEELFADHARKIYKRENDRHWRRIGERLNKVGIAKLLSHIEGNFSKGKGNNGGDDEKKSNVSTLDEKYFTKQAKLVYKIDESLFYSELFKDVMNESLGFDNRFDKKEAKKWMVEYEMYKLHSVIVSEKITKNRFQREMSSKEDVFCKKYMAFLPKKRRKVLWKKLKKDIAKQKLNHM